MRNPRLPVFLLAGTLVASAAAALDVSITSPPPGQPAFGEVPMAATVSPESAVVSVRFIVDGRVAGTVAAPPFQLTVDVGEANAEHTFSVVATAPGGESADATLVTPRIEADEEISLQMHQLYVTVTGGGAAITDLARTDFEVEDNGSAQAIEAFERGDIPFTAVILLDASTSMQGTRLRAAVESARAFVATMRPLDEAKLLVFSDRLLYTTAFTNLPEVVAAGLENVRAGGGTALNDHLYLALKLLEARAGRRVIVLLSDGFDSHSALAMRDVLHKARESQAILYWVRLLDGSGPTDAARRTSAWHDDAWYRDGLLQLRTAVVESGGREAAVGELGALVPTFEGIVRELRDQYVLGYYPSERRADGGWRRVAVRVKRGGTDVVTSKGYLDY